MATTLYVPTDPLVLGERTTLTVASAAAATGLTVTNTDGFRAKTLSVSALTSSGTTATATVASTSGLVTGDYVTVAGATPSGYNGAVQITVASTTQVTYAVAAGLTTPATGTITATRYEPVLLGELGTETAEVKTSSNVASTTSLTVAAASLAHAVNTPVSALRFDQRVLYGSATSSGTYSAVDTQTLGVDAPRGNFFVYSGSTYSYFKALYQNSITGELYPALADAEVINGAGNQLYTTVGAYKGYAGITGSAQDAEIYQAIRAWTSVVNDYLFGDSTQTLWTTTYTEYVNTPTRQSDVLVLQHAPITAVTSITVDSSTVYPGTVDVENMDGYLLYLDSELTRGYRGKRLNCTVVYTAGYTQVPAAVELACQKLVQQSVDQDMRDSAGVRSYSIGTKRVEYDTSATAERYSGAAIPPSVQALLAPYRRSKVYTWP